MDPTSLSAIAKEMIIILPGLLRTRPDVPMQGQLYQESDVLQDLNPAVPTVPSLSTEPRSPFSDSSIPSVVTQPSSPSSPPPSPSPQRARVTVCVVNRDTIDTALSLNRNALRSSPVCVLNMANPTTPGGAWRRGALAQEECLCYRTSLSITLSPDYYPLGSIAGIYSPGVLVLRKSLKDGHVLLDLREPKFLSTLSVISVPAVKAPIVERDVKGQLNYRRHKTTDLMMNKMRLILRIAMRNGHRQLVLGAFGCGAFSNPAELVARLWREVLSEPEFRNGWWKNLVFAVLDAADEVNFPSFYQYLDGLQL